MGVYDAYSMYTPGTYGCQFVQLRGVYVNNFVFLPKDS
jgi:hypothetical protein